MKPINKVILMLCMFLFLNVWTKAQTLQTFVSATSGIDSGTCLFNAPCREIVYALTQVKAGGIINIIASGEYAPCSIEKSVTIQTAPGALASIHPAQNFGYAIKINAADTDVVILRGVALQGPGYGGVIATSCGEVVIDQLTVDGIDNGISLFNRSSKNSISNTVITGTPNSIAIQVGVAQTNAGKTAVTIENTRVDRCNSGITIFCRYDTTNQTIATIRNSSVMNCINHGFWGNSSTGDVIMNLENCLSTNNGTGIRANGSNVTIRVSNSMIVNNNQGLYGTTLLSRGNNTVEGNTINGNFTGLFSAK